MQRYVNGLSSLVTVNCVLRVISLNTVVKGILEKMCAHFTLVEEDWIRGHLGKLDVHKSMVTDGMYP